MKGLKIFYSISLTNLSKRLIVGVLGNGDATLRRDTKNSKGREKPPIVLQISLKLPFKKLKHIFNIKFFDAMKLSHS
ncbi:hypothetical protein [Helicobacter cinaedi]|uniref:hypothetical protein n=1 Tax=Helicobacter cinaedi TaxID=213 RepID=UPI002163B58A|nr:hypothetical protein [Helicobacter cinaedi]